MGYGPYTVGMNAVSVTIAKVLVQVACPAGSFIQITRVWVENTDTETSNQLQAITQRLSTGASVTTATPVKKGSTGQGTSACVGGATATGTDGTTTGTVTESLAPRGFNILQGWEWIAANEMDRIAVPPGTQFALRLNSAPASATIISAGIDWFEWC